MKNNKITLKSLKQELENIKVKSSTKASKKVTPEVINKGAIGHDIKNSYINRMFLRSSGFGLYLITGILGYAHKIPFIGRIISALGLYYGRTTIWKILVKVRKMFIIINAMIGVFLVFKTAGFSTDNLIAGFAGVGETYFVMLGSLVKRMFNWFVELFDYKVVPNIPGDSGGGIFSKPSVPKSKHIFIPSNLSIPNLVEAEPFSLRKLYMSGTPTETISWYRDSNSWFWILTAALTVGVVYVGVQSYYEPMYLFNLFKSSVPTTTVTGPTPPLDPGSLPTAAAVAGGSDITLDNSSNITQKTVDFFRKVKKGLNPFNYLASASDAQSQFKVLMEVQNDYNRADRSLYPFTTHNPLDSWFKRLRLHYYGETGQEFVERRQFMEYADRIYDSLKIDKGKMIESVQASPILGDKSLWSAGNTPLGSGAITPSGTITPSLFGKPNIAAPALIEALEQASTSATQRKGLLIPTLPESLTTEWAGHTVEKVSNYFDNWKHSKTHKSFDSLDSIQSIESLDSTVAESSGLLKDKISTPSNLINRTRRWAERPTSSELTEVVDKIKVHDNPFGVFSD